MIMMDGVIMMDSNDDEGFVVLHKSNKWHGIRMVGMVASVIMNEFFFTKMKAT